jgi:ABC-2 type transport system ATP-binding protein
MTAPLEVHGLSKAYRGRPVLKGLELTMRAGEAVAVVGANGAGKSTFLGCLVGERLPDAGEVRLCGRDPFADPARAARCIGFVPEQPFLYGELTVGETLRFVAEARRVEPAAARAESVRLLELLDLRGAEGVPVRELSQGMGRKTALAAALLDRPPLLVLDEALNGLDRPSVARVLEELEARRRDGTAVLLSSHDLTLLGEWCDRGLLLAPGARWQGLEGAAWQRWRADPTLPAAGGRDADPREPTTR